MLTIFGAFLVALLILCLLALGVLLLPRRKDYLARCQFHTSRIVSLCPVVVLPGNPSKPSAPSLEYEKLARFIQKGAKKQDREFWSVSRGVRGLFDRLVISWHCSRLVQTDYDAGRISGECAREIWIMILWQAIYSLKALPEAVLCHFMGTRHINAQEALMYYCELVLQTCTLCVTNDAPECLIELQDLL